MNTLLEGALLAVAVLVARSLWRMLPVWALLFLLWQCISFLFMLAIWQIPQNPIHHPLPWWVIPFHAYLFAVVPMVGIIALIDKEVCSVPTNR